MVPATIFLSTLPAWGATHANRYYVGHKLISIHAPRVGSDHCVDNCRNLLIEFLSTLPAWGATAEFQDEPTPEKLFLSTLPAWGATTRSQMSNQSETLISIHDPRVGSDTSPL